MPKGPSQNQIRARIRQNAAAAAAAAGGGGSTNSSGEHTAAHTHSDKAPPLRRGGSRHGRGHGAQHPLLKLLPSNTILVRASMAVLIVLAVGLTVRFVMEKARTARLWTPLPLATLVTKNATAAELSPSLFWGSYRPQLYFGLKHRTPHSLLAGLMWFKQEMNSPNIRHWCEQGDRLRYSWLAHDGRQFGVQEIIDEDYKLVTSFVKRPGGSQGGDWTARISASTSSVKGRRPLSLMFYFMLPDPRLGHLTPLFSDAEQLAGIRGHTRELGEFRVQFVPHSPNQAGVQMRHSYLSTYAPREDLIKETVMYRMGTGQDNLIALAGRTNLKMENLIVYQLTSASQFDLDIVFESASNRERPGPLVGEAYSQALSQLGTKFNATYLTRLGVANAGGVSAKQAQFARSAISNMMGGIGYWYGASVVNSPASGVTADYWMGPLFSATPSRSFFPRGFLWDEGFHNLLIGRYDPEISLDIISHWLDLMNVNGWIPREQILGLEARAKVPEQFITQRDTHANPPTLFLAVQQLLPYLTRNDAGERERQLLRRLYPRLATWYAFFNVTQRGATPGSYRWRGREADNPHQLNPLTLSSGLDDYPRASHPNGEERHLDLLCWMALASRVMSQIGFTIGAEDWRSYNGAWVALRGAQVLDRMHWSEQMGGYYDYGLHTEHTRLEKPPAPKLKPGQQPPPPPKKIRRVDGEPQLQHVPAFGYVNLFPLLLQLLPADSPKLGQLLQNMSDSKLLWTRYGLRSLAPTSRYYNKHNTEDDPPYWRGAIWINVNYLAVDALRYYGKQPGQHRQLAEKLANQLAANVLNNVVGQWEATGFLWEQYHDNSGNGQRTHPFCGWTALAALML